MIASLDNQQAKKLHDLKASYELKWKQIQDNKNILLHDRSTFDAKCLDKMSICKQSAHDRLAKLKNGHQCWIDEINGHIHSHSHSIDEQIAGLRGGWHKHNEDIKCRIADE